MKNSDFRKNMHVTEENLIPRDPLKKCLWTMKVTAKISRFALMANQNREGEPTYRNLYWAINHELGDLEYKLRNGEIDKNQFEEECNKIYDNYDIDFDVLRDNLTDLESFEQERTSEKGFVLSTKFNKQAEEYRNKQKKRLIEQEGKQDKSEEHEESL